MKTNLYIPIEISKRELDSRILLSLKSIKYNFEPVITKKSRLFEKLSIIKPGIFFFKSFGPNYDIYLDKIWRINGKFYAKWKCSTIHLL